MLRKRGEVVPNMAEEADPDNVLAAKIVGSRVAYRLGQRRPVRQTGSNEVKTVRNDGIINSATTHGSTAQIELGGGITSNTKCRIDHFNPKL